MDFAIKKALSHVLDMKARNLVLVAGAFAVIGGGVDARHLKFWNIWLKRPYKGPEILVEIIGADINEKSNNEFDFWSKPDSYVACHHGKKEHKTQIEANTYLPRYLWQIKMPHETKNGIHFRVMEANVIKGDEVIGRSFLASEDVKNMMNTGEARLLEIGDGIGKLKVKVTRPPKELKQRGILGLSTKPLAEDKKQKVKG